MRRPSSSSPLHKRDRLLPRNHCGPLWRRGEGEARRGALVPLQSSSRQPAEEVRALGGHDDEDLVPLLVVEVPIANVQPVNDNAAVLVDKEPSSWQLQVR